MKRTHFARRFCLIGLASFSVSTLAYADSTTVNGTDSVYAVGGYSSIAAGIGGTAPTGIAITPGTSYLRLSATGSVSVNSGGNINDADGVGSASAETNTGYMSLSGIAAPTAGYIAGVFLAPGGPSGAAPSSLNFLSSGLGTSFTSLSPLIDQVFFVGDGMTGDGTGTAQMFYVPTGATELYLGLADACGYNGGPSCLSDNSGQFQVMFQEVGGGTPVNSPTPSTVPEPSSYLLMGTGALGMLQGLRRRFAR